nr:DUF167 domain-containing protein [Parvularcula oceani]
MVRVTAPPEGGRANRAVLKQMAKALGVPKSSLSIERGERGRDELLAVQDPPEGLEARVAGLLRAHVAER